ncbi:60S ribosomal protein L10A (nucleomorph) [Guillardia theta]|uniref:Ribosomal protein n=1 Tax=Guillardia theta TaxID=55529 RepID=Q98S08_GUITH|nr:60S ribosomal protein L10A [Guillardia theta]AAK39770.1 60S ribosomal protein L10A [Guillardia theta]|mmetsp:Transcript_36819/g.115209  ORF Transcript_36819/g.115209 Transcript_36819/m.115209 type:complete len:217 (-) Transcript_36819:745-1395(-)
MEKVSRSKLENALKSILNSSKIQKRKFNESIELQIGIKNYDPKKEKRLSGTITLPFVPKENIKIAILGDSTHIEQAKRFKIDAYDVDDLKRFNKQKKPIKKFAKQYNSFLASESIIRSIPRILGPGLNKAGKFPGLLSNSDDLLEKIKQMKSTIKIEIKKVLCIGLLIGNCDMKINEIVENLSITINFLISLLKKNWQNVKSLFVKSTMGKPVRIY